MRLLILASFLLAASASAEPEHVTGAYVQGDMMVGIAVPVAGFNAMAGAEGGLHWIGPLWAHAALSAGPAADEDGTGYNTQIRAGGEARACGFGGTVCGLFGIDLGGQHGTWSGDSESMPESFTGLVAIPRVFVDLGGSTWRFRLGIEADWLVVGNGEHAHIGVGRGIGFVGNELVTGVARLW